MNTSTRSFAANLLSPVIADIARSAKNSVIGKFFSRRSTREKYPVGSKEWITLTSAKLNNPLVKDITDIQPWQYYDRLTAAAGAAVSQTLPFFLTPQGATKTKLDTNLIMAGQLPNPKHFLVMDLRFIFSNMFAPDIEAMIAGYYIEFTIGDKIYAEGHFDTYPGGAGVYSAVSGTLAAGNVAQVASNGMPDPNAVNMWGQSNGIHILQGQNFVVKATAPNAVTLAAAAAASVGYSQQGRGLNQRAVIEGILYREVQ